MLTSSLNRLSLTMKVIVVSILMVTVSIISLLMLGTEIELWSTVNNSVQMFLFVVCVHVVRREPTKRTRLIFLNLAIVFGFSILFHLYFFIEDPAIGMLWFQYVGAFGYYFAMAFAVTYITVDLLLAQQKPIWKYLTVFAVVGGFAGFYYYPFFVDSQYLYKTPDAQDYVAIQEVFDEYVAQNGGVPSVDYLSSGTMLYSWKHGEKGHVLDEQKRLARVRELAPYLVGDNNYIILFVRPLYINIIYMCIVSVAFVLLFLGYQYFKDPPQGAYIEKIMFMFLGLCTMEILHTWSYIKSVEWASFYEIMNMGQIISIGVLLLIGLFFLLRLKFITSPNGEFYEQEIATSPAGITRWRDMFDELIIVHFLNRKHIGRFFAERKSVN